MAAIVAKPFRLALIQLGNVTANKPHNLAHARDMILRAVRDTPKKPDLVVLPECFNSPYGAQHFPQYAEEIGYTPGKAYDADKTSSESVKMLAQAAKEAGVWLIGGSIPERDAATQKLYNTSTVYDPQGSLVALHRKVHLFDIDIPGKITFKESETLSAGSTPTTFETPFGKIGLGICYDVRFPELAMLAGRQGCVAMVYPGAFNLTTGPLHWELLTRARAVDNQIFVAMCSPARDMTAGYHAWGHTTVVDPMGQIMSTTEENEDIVYADIDPEVLRSARAGIPVTAHRRFDVYTDVTTVAL
ncbi:carbon-nitrogen hydrolase [Auriculariales sp. MPI-PUGE-AT-0066]|nr:carbon-nitrogen hydrolase [Auriculariales sp. MPI-PUGE-AT-0066]